METRRSDYPNRRLDASRRVAFLETVPEGKGYFVLASRRGREGFRLSGLAVEDRRGLGRLLGEGLRQRQPESTGVYSGPVFRLHHVGLGGRTGIQRRAACSRAVHGAIVTTSPERSARQRSRGNVSGYGSHSSAWLSRFG